MLKTDLPDVPVSGLFIAEIHFKNAIFLSWVTDFFLVVIARFDFPVYGGLL